MHYIKLKSELLEKMDDCYSEYTDWRAAGNDYQQSFVIPLFREMDTPIETLIHAIIGMSGEAGELLDTAKKTWVYGKKLDEENLIEEIGDLVFYLEKALDMLGLTIEDIKAYNFVKLKKRYPDGIFKSEHAIARLDKERGNES